jgi:hypothetical protein
MVFSREYFMYLQIKAQEFPSLTTIVGQAKAK